MNKNQKGFGVLILLLAIIVTGVIGFIGWRFVANRSDSPVPQATNIPEFTSNLDVGTHHLDLKPTDKILLPSGAILSLPQRDAYSVPLFSYDSTHSSDTEKQLAIHGQLEAYHNGYKYKISKGTCQTAEKTFDDYTNVVVTDCSVDIDAQKASLVVPMAAQVSGRYTVTEKNNSPGGPLETLSADPFLYASGGEGRVTYPINNGKPYLSANDGSSATVTIVADYGVGRVSFTVDDFVNHTEKQLNIGGSTVKVKPSITCSAVYAENKTCPVVNDRFVFDVSYNRQPNNNPEVVVYGL